MAGVHRPKDIEVPITIDEEPEVISKRKSAMRYLFFLSKGLKNSQPFNNFRLTGPHIFT